MHNFSVPHLIITKTLISVILLVFLATEARTSHAQQATPVTVMPIVKIAIAEELTLTGGLIARRISNLSAEVDGIVKQVHVDDGSELAAGAPVVDLDTDIAQINREAAAADLAEAQATLEESIRRHAELQKLKDQNHTSLTSVEAARAQIAIDEAARNQARSNLKRTQTLLGKHKIVAPFSGVVNRKLVEVGQWVETSTSLVEFIDNKLLRLELPVPQYYFQSVHKKTPVQIRFDALPNQFFESTISAIIPISDQSSRTFRVRIDIDNSEGKLAPGMTAKAVLRLGNKIGADSLVAPQDALVRKPDGSALIWIINEVDGVTKAKSVEVELGRSYRDGVEIFNDALPEGTLTVVRGNEILRPGQSVRVASELDAQY